MTRRSVDQLRDGDSVEEVYLVTEKQLRANRNGNLYLQLELRDRTGAMGARMWNVGEVLDRSFGVGDFIHVGGKVQLFQGALQMIVSQIDRVEAEKVELTDFLPHTAQSVPKMLERLRGFLMKVSNPYLRALAECYLMDDQFMNGFQRAPAGMRVHHAYIGGLLEHVLAMLDLADRIAPLYPDLDRDLLTIGVFLHDSGKIRELTYDRAFGYSDEGQLIGHLAMGCEMLIEKAGQTMELTGESFPRELLLRLKHMILSHHGTLEFGSPKVPMTLEAIALHEIDSLDTRIHIALRELKDERYVGAWTPYNQALQRRLFKGGDGVLYDAPAESFD